MNQLDFKRIFTTFILCMAILFAWQWYNAKNNPQPQPEQQSQQDTFQDQSTDQSIAALSGPASDQSQWHLLLPQDHADQPVTLGSTAEQGNYQAAITLDPITASVSQSLLSEFKLNVDDEHTGYPLLSSARPARGRTTLTMMCGQLRLAGRAETFDLTRDGWVSGQLTTDPCGTQSIDYSATIVDETNSPVLTITKSYSFAQDDYELGFELAFENHTGFPIQIQSLEFYGPSGLIREDPRMDRRSVAAAFAGAENDFELEKVAANSLANEAGKESLNVESVPGKSLQWLAVSNKFFAAIMRPMPIQGQQLVNYINVGQMQAKWLTIADPDKNDKTMTSIGLKTIIKIDQPIEPGQTVACPFSLYMGPIDKDLFDEHYAGRYYEKLVPVSWCAFEWLTFALLRVLNGIYWLVGNYGIAIIIFVLLVRLILHPVTKRSQITMMKMGKMAPAIEEVKKKYANNKEELQRRTMEIYKEQGAAPIMGCLPMLLQMPIWIALYTAVDTNVALRHKGLFPASWHWLTDLSAPDRLIPFSWFGVTDPVQVPLIGGLDAINLLPILLCIAMFLQQKFSPQTAMAKNNPQQASQQKMMMFMMPVMMLLFLFTAPSGLNLYIMASTFAGLIEQHFIRKHIRQQEELASNGTVAVTTKIGARMEPKKRKPRPPQKYM